MSENFDRYTDLFLDEASEQIEQLNQNLLDLEREGYDQEIVNEIFRTAHTLKSSAAFVGLEDLSDLAHRMEDLLQEVKDEVVGVNTDLVNLFFQCLDRIKVAVAQVSEGKFPEDSFQDLIEALNIYSREHGGKGEVKEIIKKDPGSASSQKAGGAGEAKSNAGSESNKTDSPSGQQKESEDEISEDQKPAPAEVQSLSLSPITLTESDEKELGGFSEGKHVYDGVVRLDNEAPMKNMRLLLLLQNLQKKGNIYRSEPDDEDLEAGKEIYESMSFVYVTDMQREAVASLCQVDSVEEVQISEHHNPARATSIQASGDQKKTGSSGSQSSRQKKSGTLGEETHVKTKNIKVSSDKIDYLLNSVGELVITNSGLLKIYEDLQDELGDQGLLGELKTKIDQAGRIARDLQSGIMKTRMIPVELVFQRFTRPVRDLALELQKEVDLEFKGEDTELDKNIIDALNDPLLHLVRNSLDHGIETPDEREKAGKPRRAKLTLNAYQSGNNIYVEIKDDGRGLNRDGILKKAISRGLVVEDTMLPDEDIYQLIFQPGFSTAEKVSDVSGRGVGMNVVKQMVQEFKGNIQIQNEPGESLSFILSFPLTLAIISAILVRIDREEYAFPLSDVVETIKVNRDDITTLQGKDIINLRGDILPIFQLGLLMGFPEIEDLSEEFPVVIANVNNRKIGFIVDGMVGKQEIVIKSLEQNFRPVEGLIGACLMGDGSIVMVLDVQGLMEIAAKDETAMELEKTARANILGATKKYNDSVTDLTGASRRLKSGKKGTRKEDIETDEKSDSKSKQESQPDSLNGGHKKDLVSGGSINKDQADHDGKRTENQQSGELPKVDAKIEDGAVEKTESNGAEAPKREPVAVGAAARSGSSDAPVESSSSSQTAASPGPVDASGKSSDSVSEIQIEVDDAPSYKNVDGSGAMEYTASLAKSSGGSSVDDERVGQAIQSLESEKEERKRRAQNILGKRETSSEKVESITNKANESDYELTDDDYGKLYSVINTGMINAGFVLSQLLGVTVEVSVPEFKTIEVKELEEYVPAEKVIGIALDTEGDFHALIVLIFDEANGKKAASDLMGLSVDSSDNVEEEDVKSVLSELTNIVGSSILNALANKTGLGITPMVPAYTKGEPGVIVEQIEGLGYDQADMKAIYISADFYRDDMELLGRVFLLPTRSTLATVIRKL